MITTLDTTSSATGPYDEYNTPTSSSSSPDAMAFMLEDAQLHPGLRILEIGTGTGYNAALLAHILGNPRLVFTVEIDPTLAKRAQHRLDQVAGEGITMHAGNGLHGFAAGAPYTRIIATGSYPRFRWPGSINYRPGVSS